MRSSSASSELDAIFGKHDIKKIDFDSLHRFTARLFSESMTNLNRLHENLAEIKQVQIDPQLTGKEKEAAVSAKKEKIKDIDEQISTLKRRNNDYIDSMKSHIIESCKDRKSIKRWLEVAKDCERMGDDTLGMTIRVSLLDERIKGRLRSFMKNSKVFKELNAGYFDVFFSSGNYKGYVINSMKEATAPALPTYFTNLENAAAREDKFKNLIVLKNALTKDEWIAAFIKLEWAMSNAKIMRKHQEPGYDRAKECKAALAERFPDKTHLVDSIYSEICDLSSYEELEKKFKFAESYFKKTENNEKDPFFEKYQAATNAQLIDRTSLLLPEVKYVEPPKPIIPKPVAQPAQKVEYIGPRQQQEKINLLTPKGMVNRYHSLMDKLGIDYNGKLKKEFKHNMHAISMGRIAHKKKLKTPMPTSSQISEFLFDQDLERKNIINELKYAKRIHKAINALGANGNVSAADLNQFAASFNHQVKRILSNVNVIGDSELASEASALLIPVNREEVLRTNTKGKEELYDAPKPSQEPPVQKPSTAEKRQHLTKNYGGLFNRPEAPATDQNAGDKNRPDSPETRIKSKK